MKRLHNFKREKKLKFKSKVLFFQIDKSCILFLSFLEKKLFWIGNIFRSGQTPEKLITAEDSSDDADDSETTSTEAPPDVDVVQVLELDEPVLESGIVEDERYFEFYAKSFSFFETFAPF